MNDKNIYVQLNSLFIILKIFQNHKLNYLNKLILIDLLFIYKFNEILFSFHNFYYFLQKDCREIQTTEFVMAQSYSGWTKKLHQENV